MPKINIEKLSNDTGKLNQKKEIREFRVLPTTGVEPMTELRRLVVNSLFFSKRFMLTGVDSNL